MKAYTFGLGIFAGLVFAQDSGGVLPDGAAGAIGRCSKTALDACPADVSAAHRCLLVEKIIDEVITEQCISSCPADSGCLSRCGTAGGAAWCDGSGGCYCDLGWDSAQAATPNPEDFSWVKKWAAVGDSYSAGIGSGNPYPNSSVGCARYDQSYPAYIQSHDLMPQNPPANFEFLACSGATSPQILESQVSALGTGYDLITVSAGGNDVGLSSLLNACVFQWNPFSNCPDEMQATLNLIRDTLPGNLDKLYAGLKDKINPGRKIYVTGYATFFDNTTTACDKVSWAFWFNSENKQFLTTERRTLMNELTLATNAAIEAAVKRAGAAFEYVGYDQYYSVLRGRFCESGTTEPDGNRDGLLFFQWSSKSADPTLLTRREAEISDVLQFDNAFTAPGATIREAELPPLGVRGSSLGLLGTFHKRAWQIWSSLQGRRVDNSRTITPVLDARQAASNASVTIEQYIANSISEARTKNSTLVISLPDNSAADPTFRGRTNLEVSDFIGDEIKRVFHPRPPGHAVIANLVVWRMTEDNAAALGVGSKAATEAAGCAVPATTVPTLPKTIPGVLPNCQAAALACLSCLGSASGLGIFACNFRHHSDCNACGGGDGCPC